MTTGLRNHIHLSEDIGAGPEDSPDATYKVVEGGRQDHPTVFVSVERSLTGKLRPGALVDGSGDPLVFNSLSLSLKVSPSEYEALKGILGRVVYYVDNFHAADGEDHSGDVRSVFFYKMEKQESPSPAEIYYIVRVELEDNDTV